jgi:hypothetical protein
MCHLIIRRGPEGRSSKREPSPEGLGLLRNDDERRRCGTLPGLYLGQPGPSGEIPRRRRSRQLGIFRLGLPEDRDVGVCILPQRKEVLVRRFRLGVIPR